MRSGQIRFFFRRGDGRAPFRTRRQPPGRHSARRRAAPHRPGSFGRTAGCRAAPSLPLTFRRSGRTPAPPFGKGLRPPPLPSGGRIRQRRQAEKDLRQRRRARNIRSFGRSPRCRQRVPSAAADSVFAGRQSGILQYDRLFPVRQSLQRKRTVGALVARIKFDSGPSRRICFQRIAPIDRGSQIAFRCIALTVGFVFRRVKFGGFLIAQRR